MFASVSALVAMFRWEAIPWRMHAILVFGVGACLLPSCRWLRALVRQRLARRPWWGVPVVVLGAGKTGRTLVRALRGRPQLGLRPVLVLDDDAKKLGSLTATLGEDEDIEVHTRRDVPVGPASSAEFASSSSFLAARAFAAFADTEPSRPALERRAPPAHDAASLDLPPHTIRSPQPTLGPARRFGAAPGPGGPATPLRHRRERAAIARHKAVEPSLKPGFSSSSRRHDPSWLHQIPDSIRGLVRGQFAEIEGVPIVGGLEIAPLLAERLGIFVRDRGDAGDRMQRKLLEVTERIGGAFPHLLVIPDLIGFASLGVPAREIAGVVGIEVRQQLLLRGPRFAKRVMDLALTILGGIFVFPIIVLLALIIRLDSKGSAFYSQERLGRGGKLFIAHKFRTMHGDGEERLKAVLEADPKCRAEYEEFHKAPLFDPRITRVGRILRKYSLDELPQLWNVVRGEMSLVGPRPYLQRELPEMANHEHIILRSVPGMTGLWQVGDRNSTGFAERLKMDMHYVKNWSPWLDLYVLARTFGVVLGGTGS